MKLVWGCLSGNSSGNIVLKLRVGAVPKNTNKAKKARNAKKAAGKVLREGGLGRRVLSGSAESEAGPLIS